MIDQKNCDASAIAELKAVVEKLRSEDGCAWDKVQTHESLRRCSDRGRGRAFYF